MSDHVITKFSAMGKFTYPSCSPDARFVRARAPLINENVDDKNARRQTHAPLSKQIKFYYKKGNSDKLIALFIRNKSFELIVVMCSVFLFLPHFKHDVKIVCLMWHFTEQRKKDVFTCYAFYSRGRKTGQKYLVLTNAFVRYPGDNSFSISLCQQFYMNFTIFLLLDQTFFISLEREIKKQTNKQRRHFLLEEQHENFVAVVTKREISAATNAR